MVKVPIYVIQDESSGLYYAGRKISGKAICDERREDDACEMEEDEVNRDFPKGLPKGLKKVVLYHLDKKNP